MREHMVRIQIQYDMNCTMPSGDIQTRYPAAIEKRKIKVSNLYMDFTN